MGEIKLGCPKCGTEYRLPKEAIPETGREVECTACGHSWLALAPSAGSADMAGKPAVVRHAASESGASADSDESRSPAPADIPPLQRRLPDNVLSILREEVEFERRARQGENITQNSSGSSDPDWPATTVTDPGATPDIRDLPHSLPTADSTPEAQVASILPLPAEANPRPAPVETRPETDMPAAAQTSAAQPSRKGRSGYFAGFGLAAGIAAAALALYILAPGMSDNRAFGKQLTQYRQHVDAGRQWLHQQGSALTGRD